jgi:hypothetical protein
VNGVGCLILISVGLSVISFGGLEVSEVSVEGSGRCEEAEERNFASSSSASLSVRSKSCRICSSKSFGRRRSSSFDDGCSSSSISLSVSSTNEVGFLSPTFAKENRFSLGPAIGVSWDASCTDADLFLCRCAVIMSSTLRSGVVGRVVGSGCR